MGIAAPAAEVHRKMAGGRYHFEVRAEEIFCAEDKFANSPKLPAGAAVHLPL
jgi:hypothetical protein